MHKLNKNFNINVKIITKCMIPKILDKSIQPYPNRKKCLHFKYLIALKKAGSGKICFCDHYQNFLKDMYRRLPSVKV